MCKIISKNYNAKYGTTYITYNVSELNGGNMFAEIYANLIASGIQINRIIVNVYSNSGISEEEKLFFGDINDYMKEYDVTFNENSIQGISLSCYYNKLSFRLDVIPEIKKVFVKVDGNVNSNTFNIDNVIEKTGPSR